MNFKTWFWFTFRNPVVKRGEIGGFKYVFRNLSFELETISGNFKARWTADRDPFGMLLAAQSEEDIHGYAATIYLVSKYLTADQEFVDTVQKAITDYQKRLEGKVEVVEDETEEKIALEEVKQVQEYVEMPKKEQKKREREINGRFKKAVKSVEDEK